MVNLWGTFCGPCINEMPHLGEISKEYADKGVAVVGILVDVTDNDGNVFEPQYNNALDIVAQTKVEYVNIIPSKELMLKKVASVSSKVSDVVGNFATKLEAASSKTVS